MTIHPIIQNSELIKGEQTIKIVSDTLVRNLVEEYFRTSIDVDDFSISRNKLSFLEVIKKNRELGYLFLGVLEPFGFPINFMGRIKAMEEKYNEYPRRVSYQFVNYKNKVAGFSWEVMK